jgi:hypothetical protein
VLTVVDYKTRGKVEKKPTVYDKTRMQLGALSGATEVAVPDGDGWTVQPVDSRAAMAVVLYPDGTFHAEPVEPLYRWQVAFNAASDLWHAVKGTPSPAQGGEAGEAARAERSSAEPNGRAA